MLKVKRVRLARRPGRPRRVHDMGPIRVWQILRWADAYFRRTGAWPLQNSGGIEARPGLTWAAVDAALRGGGHGLRGGDSLTRLLCRHRGVGERRGRKPCRQRRALVCTLHARGLSAAAIGRKLGVSRQAAWALLQHARAAAKKRERLPNRASA